MVTTTPNTAGGGGATGGGGSYGGGGGYNIPDFASLIENDPSYLQLKADLAAQGISDAAARKTAINRAITQFGYLPDFNSLDQTFLGGNLQGDIDPATAGLVDRNNEAGFSTKARLAQAHEDAVRNITNALASRGLLRSGEAGYQFGRENQAYGQANYDATQKLLDYLGGVQAAFAQSERARQGELRGGARDAAAFQLQLANLLGYGGAYGGSSGGSGANINWTSGSREALAAAGYSDEQIAGIINQYASQHGWGPYWENGVGTNYGVQQNGQMFNADGSLYSGSGTPYIYVKVHTPTGNSTELIPLTPPSGGGQQAPPPPAPPPPPPTQTPIGVTAPIVQQPYRSPGGTARTPV